MTLFRWQQIGSWLAVAGLMASPALAGGSANSAAPIGGAAAPGPVVTSRIQDVALGAGGSLNGQVVTTAGAAANGQQVLVRHASLGTVALQAESDGRFAATGLRGGVYQIAAGDAVKVVRLWAPGTAPPTATSEVLVVADGDVLRGQAAVQGPIMNFISNPWVIGGVVATAIAVPVALSNEKESNS
jgi:hypothetical protein